MHKHLANKLVNSTSPYLLQHAYNPVHWQPWSPDALKEAVSRDVPIILSIGYSSCHWCHVMERESFENEELAEIMNQNFVCIKVDREERPDIDQIYMEAVHSMGLQGGWPLNVFLTPDQKPFYGGTYFPPAQWRQVCTGVAKSFKINKEQIYESAESFSKDLNHSELQRYGIVLLDKKPELDVLKKMTRVLQNKFDPKFGGMDKAPKFPMPSIWKFLLYANSILKSEEIGKQVEATLDKMAAGGIYDQMGGGFSRYSVDARWFAPHFEKMLYDNGQLISLYAEAYRIYPKVQYREVVYESIAFIEREMMSDQFGFYAALDADSEGKEGKFYVWKTNELKEILGDDYPLFAEYYQVEEEGNWEEGENILHRQYSAEEFASVHNIDLKVFNNKLVEWKNALLKARSNRIRPGLDNKILSGWNGLMLKGLTDAYRTFGEIHFLELAQKNAQFTEDNLIVDNQLLRLANSRNNENTLAVLEDYAFAIDGLIGLYQCQFEEKWMLLAKKLADTAIVLFFDEKEKYFFYTPVNGENLIARKKELFDNVIPASNSQMAINLYTLSKYFYSEDYETRSTDMLKGLMKLIENDPAYLANWAILYFYQTFETVEINIVGKKVVESAREFDRTHLFNKILAGKTGQSELPVLADRIRVADRDTIYVCYNKTCKLPVHSVEEAIKQIDFEPGRH